MKETAVSRNDMHTGRQNATSHQRVRLSAKGSNHFENLHIRCRDEGLQGCFDINNLFSSEEHTHSHQNDLNAHQSIKPSAEGLNRFENVKIRPYNTRLQGFSNVKEQNNLRNDVRDGERDGNGCRPVKTSVESSNLLDNLCVTCWKGCFQGYWNDRRRIDSETRIRADGRKDNGCQSTKQKREECHSP